MSTYWRIVCAVVFGLLLGAMSCNKKTETNDAPNSNLSSEGEGKDNKLAVEKSIVDDPTTAMIPGDNGIVRVDVSSTRVSAKTNYPCFFTDTYEVGLVTINENDAILDDIDYSNRVVDTFALSPSGPARNIQNDFIRVLGEAVSSQMQDYDEIFEGGHAIVPCLWEVYVCNINTCWELSRNTPEYIHVKDEKNTKGFFIDGYYFRWGLDFKTTLSRLNDVSAKRSVQYELKTEGDFIIFIINSRCGLGLYFSSYPEKVKDYLNSVSFYSRQSSSVRHIEPTERKR